MLASALVDTSALWNIIAASLAAGAGVVVAFGLALVGASRFSQDRDGSALARAGYGLLVISCAAFCIAAVVIGFWAMTKK
jgi:hypothetical protein